MPRLLREKKTSYPLFAKNWHQNQPGFVLVEIVLSLFLVLAIASILLAAAATYRHSRNAALQSLATNIASRDIENQRKLVFSGVSTSAITDSDSGKLPSYNGQRTVATYDGNTKIKQVTDVITWVEKGVTRQIKLETLISENGL